MSRRTFAPTVERHESIHEARGRPYAKPIWRACLEMIERSEATFALRFDRTDRPTSYFVFIELPGNCDGSNSDGVSWRVHSLLLLPSLFSIARTFRALQAYSLTLLTRPPKLPSVTNVSKYHLRYIQQTHRINYIGRLVKLETNQLGNNA